jgi:sodium-independent sulfate anion transporter 11
MGCFVYILFGSTQAITIGPTAIVAIITMTYAQGKPPEYAVLLCFATGIVTLLMGICQLGMQI